MTLRVVIREGTFLKNHDFLSNMDPYAVAFVGASRQRTPTCQQGGKHPRWESALNFQATDTKMRIQLWDEDVVNDDLIGKASVDLTKFYNSPGATFNEVVEVERYGKRAGTITIMVQYNGPPLQPKLNNPYVQQQMVQQQAPYANMYGNYQPQPQNYGYNNNMNRVQQGPMMASQNYQMNQMNQVHNMNQMNHSAGMYPQMGNSMNPSMRESAEAINRIQNILGKNITHSNPSYYGNTGMNQPPPLPPGLSPAALGMNLLGRLAVNEWDPNFSGR